MARDGSRFCRVGIMGFAVEAGCMVNWKILANVSIFCVIF